MEKDGIYQYWEAAGGITNHLLAEQEWWESLQTSSPHGSSGKLRSSRWCSPHNGHVLINAGLEFLSGGPGLSAQTAVRRTSSGLKQCWRQSGKEL